MTGLSAASLKEPSEGLNAYFSMSASSAAWSG